MLCLIDQAYTGAVTLAGLLAAHRHLGRSLIESRIVCIGAGSSGIGVSNALVDGEKKREKEEGRIIEEEGIRQGKRAQWYT